MSSSCSIVFNENPNGIYSGGEVLSGKVNLETDKIKAIKGIYITIYGYAEVEWNEEESTTGAEGQNDTETVIFKARDEYFSTRVEALESQDGNRFDLMPGRYNFDFQIQLPRNLPTSFHGKHGEIRYEVVCTIDRPWRFNNVFKQPFNIISSVDLNANPMYRQPSDHSTVKYFSRLCCCGSAGQIMVKGYIPYTGFAPGQSIPVKVFIKNLTNIECNETNIKLLKIVEYRSNKPRPKSKYEIEYLVVQKMGTLDKSQSKELNCKLRIPPTPPSSLNSCKIIEISYYAEVQIKTQGFHTNMHVRLPITIGTVPMFYGATTSSTIITSQPMSIQGGVNASHMAGLIKKAPPSYEEAMQLGPKYTSNSEENQYLTRTVFVPRYPVYHYSPELDISPSHAHGGDNNCVELNGVSPGLSKEQFPKAIDVI